MTSDGDQWENCKVNKTGTGNLICPGNCNQPSPKLELVDWIRFADRIFYVCEERFADAVARQRSNHAVGPVGMETHC